MDNIEKNIEGKKKWSAPKLLKLDQKATEGGAGTGFESVYTGTQS
ncbi:MAG: hypothetical protein PF487_03635 [Bacteroidales bacterium]|jgi:hypothetical protein|nr:hypothetical protein [Bacteroidales bacterium]